MHFFDLLHLVGMTTLKHYTLAILCIFSSFHVTAQTIQLTDHLLMPRLDSANWEKDFAAISAGYSYSANKFQFCTETESDSTRNKFCFNTTLGHVRLDTVLLTATPEKLKGEWQLMQFGTFEVTDSMLVDAPVYDRKLLMVHEYKDPAGKITFTDTKFSLDFKNIEEYSTFKGNYTVLEGKYLSLKKIIHRSASTIIGLTNDGFLILDDHTYKTIARRESYLVIKTTIRRMILKRL